MATVPPFDSADIPAEWVRDSAQFTHFGKKVKGYVTQWKMAWGKANANVKDFSADPSEDMKDLANSSLQKMEVAFYAITNAFEAVVCIAGDNTDLKTKAAGMKAKFAQYGQLGRPLGRSEGRL